MLEHLLVFEVNDDADELFIHGDPAGLRRLATLLIALADKSEAGDFPHEHLFTPEWGGAELSSVAQESGQVVFNHVKIFAWPDSRGASPYRGSSGDSGDGQSRLFPKSTSATTARKNDLLTGSVALTFVARTISAEEITERMGVTPYSYCNAGESVSSIRGKVISTGVHASTGWTYVLDVEMHGGFYDIEVRLIELLKLCESNKDLVEDILRDAGTAQAQIRLAGNHNIGDVFSVDTLKRLASLGVSLSIEVFPD